MILLCNFPKYTHHCRKPYILHDVNSCYPVRMALPIVFIRHGIGRVREYLPGYLRIFSLDKVILAMIKFDGRKPNLRSVICYLEPVPGR